MRLTLKIDPKFTKEQLLIVEELSFHTSKLYNIANYLCREERWLSYVDLEKNFKGNWHRQALHSHTYQQCLKMLDQDWRSYFRAREDYNKNPHKYLGPPRMPGYKGVYNKNQVIFTNYAVRIHGRVLKLSLSKGMQKSHHVKSLNVTLPKWVLQHVGKAGIQQVVCRWDKVQKKWTLCVIYKREERSVDPSSHNVMSIDLGLDNLCAIETLLPRSLLAAKP